MGMFDYIYDRNLKCPYCGASNNLEIQTKDYDCALDTIAIHYKSDKKLPSILRQIGSMRYDATTKVREVEAWGDCASPICRTIARARNFILLGYISGFGRGFDIKYATDKKGIAIGPAIEVKKTDNLTAADLPKIKKLFEKALKSVSKEHQEDFKACLKKTGNDWSLAVLSWSVMTSAKMENDPKILKFLGEF